MDIRLASRTAAMLLACLAALLGAGVALAHPQIVSVEPPADARLDAPPARVMVAFNEPIEALSTLTLYSSRGEVMARGGGRDPADPTRLVLALAPLEPGLYTAVWTVAGSDGHVVRGNFAFTILGAAPAGATPAPAAQPAPAAEPAPLPAPLAQTSFPLGQSLARWALLLGTTGAVGGWAFWLWVALPALGDATAPAGAVRRWRRWSAALLLAAMVAAPLLFVAYVAELGAGLDVALLGLALGSRQGLLAVARTLLAAALLGLTLATRDGAAIRRRAPIALAVGCALLLAGAMAGHAGAAARPFVAVAFAWLHLAATSLWAGGLLLFALALGPLLQARPAPARPALLRDLMTRFSPLAMGSVAALVLSGGAAALRELPDLPALWLTPYGQALGVKLLLFGVMLALGAYHLRVARQGGRSEDGGLPTPAPARAARGLWAEGGAAILALAAAGALTSLAPPAGPTAPALAAVAVAPTAIVVPTVTPGPTRTPVPSRPFDAALPAGDLLVRLAVAPASLGENRFQVTVTDQAGQQVAVQLIRLSFAMREMDMGEQALEATQAPGGEAVLSGSPLSMVGEWEIDVLVRRAGLPDVTATFTVPVGE